MNAVCLKCLVEMKIETLTLIAKDEDGLFWSLTEYKCPVCGYQCAARSQRDPVVPKNHLDYASQAEIIMSGSYKVKEVVRDAEQRARDFQRQERRRQEDSEREEQLRQRVAYNRPSVGYTSQLDPEAFARALRAFSSMATDNEQVD